MMELPWLLPLISALIAAFLFARCYRYAYPVASRSEALLSRAEAIDSARLALHRLTSLDVGSWSAMATLHVDDEVIEQLHHREQLEPNANRLERSGISGSWRVRFIGAERQTVMVGIVHSGAVVLLDVSAQARELILDELLSGSPQQLTELTNRLDGDTSGTWRRLRGTGSGTVDRGRLGVERSSFFSDTFDPVSIEYQVDTVGRAIVRVDHIVSITEDVDTSRATGREAVINAWSMAGSVAAMVIGVVLLATVGTVGHPWATVTLAAATGLAAIGNELAGLERAGVNIFDGDMMPTTFRLINYSVSAVSVAVSAAVVLVAGLAGSAVAKPLGLPLWDDLCAQLLWGAWFALLWLGLAASTFATLRRHNLVRIAETPDRRTLRLGGLRLPQIAGIVVQSAVSEEIVFRLLGMAVITWLTGNIVVAAIITAVLWATMHTGSAIAPRFGRTIELTIVGVGLGLLAAEIGFVAALVAHALFNAVTLLGPVLTGREGAGNSRTAHPASGRTAA